MEIWKKYGLESDWWLNYDLPHYGALYSRVRNRVDIDPETIRQLCTVADTTITRNIEEEGRKSASYECYVKALASNFAHPPITPRQADLLLQVFRHSNDRTKRQDEFARIGFSDFRSRKQPDRFRELRLELEQQDQPAFIMDALWFIHAVNGAALRLFEIDPYRSEYLHNWYAWHVLATKFHPQSPVRLGHINIDQYFPPAIDHFFWNEFTRPLLFTWQLRALLYRLHELSKDDEMKFTRLWTGATSFSLEYELRSLTRSIKYLGGEIQTTITEFATQDIKFEEGPTLPLTLVVWHPKYVDAEEAFAQIRQSPDYSTIFYAADFDENKDFHVNTWPEVKDEV